MGLMSYVKQRLIDWLVLGAETPAPSIQERQGATPTFSPAATCLDCRELSFDLRQLVCDHCGSRHLHFLRGRTEGGFDVWHNTEITDVEYWCLRGWPMVVQKAGRARVVYRALVVEDE